MASRYLLSNPKYTADLSPQTDHPRIYMSENSFEELVKFNKTHRVPFCWLILARGSFQTLGT